MECVWRVNASFPASSQWSPALDGSIMNVFCTCAHAYLCTTQCFHLHVILDSQGRKYTLEIRTRKACILLLGMGSFGMTKMCKAWLRGFVYCTSHFFKGVFGAIFSSTRLICINCNYIISFVITFVETLALEGNCVVAVLYSWCPSSRTCTYRVSLVISVYWSVYWYLFIVRCKAHNIHSHRASTWPPWVDSVWRQILAEHFSPLSLWKVVSWFGAKCLI